MSPKKRIGIATGVTLVGLGMTLAAGSELAWAVSLCIVVAGALSLFTTLRSGHSSAWIRLDLFLPVLRKERPSRPTRPAGITYRIARRLLPIALFSNRLTKARGQGRKWLRALGPTWLSSPIRRLVQTVCLLTFFWLFLVTCWPYGARPADSANAVISGSIDSLDQESGTVNLAFAGDLESLADAAAQWHLVALPEGSASDATKPTRSYAVRLHGQEDNQLTLEPVDANEFMDLVTSTEEFTLYDRDPSAWPQHYAENLERKEWIPADLFLVIDPLVSISTAIASRSWVWSLTSAGIILIVCVVVPRGFCGYICPLGTIIELFDWGVSNRVKRFRVSDDGWWVHIKYYLLASVLVCAVCGVLISGVFAAIPVVTRASLFLFDPVQSGTARGWHLIPAFNWGHWISLLLFAAVLAIGLLRPRFWCKYVCPSGAVFSLGNLFRLTERKVESSCINCNKCIEICPFDAIKPDFTTRVTDCTQCQSCAGVCPTHAIKFVERWNFVELKVENEPPTNETSIGRRGFLSAASGSVVALATGLGAAAAVQTSQANATSGVLPPVRPPGSVPEDLFLQMCIRCGECFKACPNNVLQPESFEQGLAGLWTPQVAADWAGCESSCNACGQVCPTGAIRELPLFEKRHARMGLAIVNEQTCLPYAGAEACDLCIQECKAAGYDAIEYVNVGTQADESGQPIEGSGYLAPLVDPTKCVGCGLCQTRCYSINKKQRGLIVESAIIIIAGDEYEDRMLTGSYAEKRRVEARERANQQAADAIPQTPLAEPSTDSETMDDNPFGL